IGESSLPGLELVQETTDKVVLIKEKLKAARDRQKSYADKRHKPLEFEVGDQVLLKVTPWKGVVYFGKKGKLTPRYVGPFEILERIGLVAYRLRLPEELSSMHDTFHVSNLKKCLADANLHVPLVEIKVDKTLCFVEEPVDFMDREIKKLRSRKITLVKVRWNSKRGLEFTWEHEDQMRIKSPRNISSSDKTVPEELTATISPTTATTSKDSSTTKHKKRVISYKTKTLLGSIASMCQRCGQIQSHIKYKFITHEFFMSKIREVLDHCNKVILEITFSKTNEMIREEMPRLVNLAVNKDRDVDPINAQEMIAKEFATHGPKMIEELFRKHMQNTTLNLYPTTSTSTSGKSSADLQH
ncbi:hypothetical protein Tco_0865935, partial [Tanacetum coccineum]